MRRPGRGTKARTAWGLPPSDRRRWLSADRPGGSSGCVSGRRRRRRRRRAAGGQLAAAAGAPAKNSATVSTVIAMAEDTPRMEPLPAWQITCGDRAHGTGTEAAAIGRERKQGRKDKEEEGSRQAHHQVWEVLRASGVVHQAAVPVPPRGHQPRLLRRRRAGHDPAGSDSNS